MNSNTTGSTSKMILFFFNLQVHVKMYHWQTSAYANHRTTNALYQRLNELVDSFVEKYVGVFGRPMMRADATISVQNMNASKFVSMLDDAEDYLRGPLNKTISKKSELMNIRDELLAELDQTRYLLRLS